jgi:capsular polysaccharide export protein
VLIEYPVYLSRCSGRFATPERALEELLLWREEGSSRLPLWRRLWRLIVKAGVRGK